MYRKRERQTHRHIPHKEAATQRHTHRETDTQRYADTDTQRHTHTWKEEGREALEWFYVKQCGIAAAAGT